MSPRPPTPATAGYVVVCTEGVIWGAGATPETAWADMLREMQMNSVTVLSDEEAAERDPMAERTHEYSLASGFKVHPATAGLLERVTAYGGAIAWRLIDGTACTVDEDDDYAEAAKALGAAP